MNKKTIMVVAMLVLVLVAVFSPFVSRVFADEPTAIPAPDLPAVDLTTNFSPAVIGWGIGITVAIAIMLFVIKLPKKVIR